MATVTAVDTFLTSSAPKIEPKRDRYGRYLLPDPNTGTETAYQRSTTLGKLLGDTWAIDHWNRRMVAKGLTMRSDLYAQVAAATLDEKKLLNELCEQAAEAAGSSEGRNKGSALHRFAERVDAGERDVMIPAPFDADIAAYRKILADEQIVPVPGLAERIVVCPEIGVAGTFDRVLRCLRWPTDRIGDLKTAQTIWDWLEIAVQLAVYVHGAAIFDLRTQAYIEMPKVDQDVAVVMHVPAGSGAATLYEVDVAVGWEAALYAVGVREWRRRKNIAHALAAADVAPLASTSTETNGVDDGQPPPPSTPGLIHASLERKVRGMTTEQQLALSLELAKRGLPRLSQATPAHMPEWVQAVGTVTGPTLNGARVTSNRDALTVRVQALVDVVGGIAALQMQLTLRALPRLSECPDDLLDEWTDALWDAERQVGAPFPAGEDDDREASRQPVQVPSPAGWPATSPADPFNGLPGSTPEKSIATEQLAQRYEALPADLRAKVDAARVGTILEGVSIKSGGTPDQIAMTELFLNDAESELRARQRSVEALLADFDDEMRTCLLAESEGDVDQLAVLVGAIDLAIVGFTYEDDKPVLMSTDRAYDVITETHGGKGPALKAAQATAKQLGRPVPRTAAAAATDPVLAAHVAKGK